MRLCGKNMSERDLKIKKWLQSRKIVKSCLHLYHMGCWNIYVQTPWKLHRKCWGLQIYTTNSNLPTVCLSQCVISWWVCVLPELQTANQLCTPSVTMPTISISSFQHITLNRINAFLELLMALHLFGTKIVSPIKALWTMQKFLSKMKTRRFEFHYFPLLHEQSTTWTLFLVVGLLFFKHLILIMPKTCLFRIVQKSAPFHRNDTPFQPLF